MRKLLLIPLLVTLLYASHENIGVTPEGRALGESFVAGAFGFNGIFFNPGALTFGERLEFSVSYEKPYGGLDISGLNSVTMGLKYKNFGIGISEYGLKLEGEYSGTYAEGFYAFSYARAFGTFGVGANLDVYKFQDPRFGSTYYAGLDLGLCSRVSEWVGAGIYYRNVLGASIRGDKLPQYLDAGIGISIQDLSTTFLSLRMSPSGSVIFMGGEEFSVARGVLKLRAGLDYGDNITKGSFGLGLKIKGITVNYAYSTNFELSPAHAFGITWGRE
ncbi:MAG: hypothetical protein PHQ71_04140 [Candidatus Hydrothermia bacterium]|nr:hypothetical protein [Candidatus Hydrothermia bacterium]